MRKQMTKLALDGRNRPNALPQWDTLFLAGPLAYNVSYEKVNLFRPWDTLPT
jgi:hypothetical protein